MEYTKKYVENLEKKYEEQRNLLIRLRQWDMLVGGMNAYGEHQEATADAPYWRSEIDKVLS